MKNVRMNAGKDLYVRIPESLHKIGLLKIILPEECTNKTLHITVIDNDEAPFAKDAIYCEGEKSDLSYFGRSEIWEPTEYSRTVVKGNPDCDYSECNLECHVVSCAVHQGYESSEPLEIKYLRSDKVK